MKYLIISIIVILVFIVSCEISTTAYEQTLLEVCANKPVVTLLKSKTKIECKVVYD